MLDHVLRRARRIDLKAIETGHPGHPVRLPHAGDEASAYARHTFERADTVRLVGERGAGRRGWLPQPSTAGRDGCIGATVPNLTRRSPVSLRTACR